MKDFYLGPQNKIFRNDNKDLLVMLVRVAPFLGLGLLAAILGYQLANLVPVPARVYLQIVFLGLIFSMIILDEEPGWNLVLLISFGIAAGMILHWSGDGFLRLNSRVIFAVLVIISLVGGVFIQGSGGRAAGMLFFSTLLYMAGWILLTFVQLPDLVGTKWTVLGLVLFTLILMAAISQGKTRNDEGSAIPLSIQLFVVLYNICWLSSLL
jgi:hypothetical protein